jgi:MFS family permease
VPLFMVLFAVGNFLGPLLLGRLFDTVGRIPMIAGTYLGSAAVVVALALLLRSGELTTAGFMALVCGAFFLASAGASAAYLTVSEIFPMETRALAIAFFYALGTAIGGIVGPYLFGQFIHSGSVDQVATGFLIGAAAMALGGVAELLWGVPAEGKSLEAIAAPLSAEGELEPTAAERRRERERRGLRRFKPGIGRGEAFSALDDDVEREIAALCEALESPAERAELARRVGARGWGPGRYRAALREALAEGRVRRDSRGTYTAE